MGEKVANGAPLDLGVVPERGGSFFESWRTVDDGGVRLSQVAIGEILRA